LSSPHPIRQSQQILAAYAACRAIAKREARNFYYSFLALPPHKRDAMCAVYAFMRRADDISDDEGKDHATRRAELAQWSAAWRDGRDTSNPVFVAVRDTQQRFHIEDALLEQLIHGTAMDLQPEAEGRRGPDGLDTFQSFSDLYTYCYYVASVVGLVCIRIFGYRDAAAEKLGEETGIAFQLTNILRDVREDAERGRVYIPVDDLASAGVTAAELTQIRDGAALTDAERNVLAGMARRARAYYQSAERLLPLIEPDSRPALRVLVEIYRRLLDRIEARRFDVFTIRVQVPTWQKLAILLGGMVRMGALRLRGAAQ
jgi:15-cis-phytoene synthase